MVENRFKILLVDRDQEGVEQLKNILFSVGYEVKTAYDGDKAIDLIESAKPDLIISEVNIPKVDGWELCWIIRERPEFSDIPFVFLTSKAKVSDEVLSFELGADDYIKKPYIRNELLARIKGLLGRLERARQSTLSSTGVKGNLKDMSMSDILQVLNVGKRTAAVHISKGESRGSIFVTEGKVVHARCGDVRGEDALFNIMAWEDGSFLVEGGATTNIKSINHSTEMILLEGYKRMDEGKMRGAPPQSEAMEEGEVLTLKTLFDLGIIEDNRRGEK